jgi:predicted amidohydrolase
MREITVATVQMKPELGRVGDNLVKMSDYIADIVRDQKVDLIVFPELAISGYELGMQFTELAQRVPGAAVNLLAQRAADAGVYLAFGMPTKEKVESILYNSAVLLGPSGDLLGVYHKVHLRGEERMVFREGFKIPVFDTGEIGKIGMMIGSDLAFPEVARAMTLEGAELVCCLGSWEQQYIDEWRVYARARAYENAIFLAAANRIGEDVALRFGGESLIVSPRGKVLATLSVEVDMLREMQREQEALIKELEQAQALRAEEFKQARALQEALRAAQAAALEAAKRIEELERAAQKVAEPAALAVNSAERAPEPDSQASAPSAAEPAADAKPEATFKPLELPLISDEPPDLRVRRPEPPKPAEPREGYCIARIDLDEVRRCREQFQTLQARYPTAYRIIVKRY